MTSHSNSRRATPPGRGRKEWRRAVILIVLAVLMVLAATVVVLYNRWFQRPELPNGDPAASGDPVASQGTDLDSVQPKVGGARKSEDFYTILVFGPDETSGLTDVMMLVSYDVTNQKATVMSFPRDTLINSSGRSPSQKMLNAVYNRYGQGEDGIEGLKNEVAELVGFVPDYYVRIDWQLVGKMVEAIGGVWFDIPYNMQYDDPYQDLHIHFEPGRTFLNGEDAMKVIRWRENNYGVPSGSDGSDTSRIELRNEFLKTVLRQTLQLKNVTKIGELAELFGENVQSDLSIENLFWFGSQAVLGGLQVDDVNFVTMPYYGVAPGNPYYGRVYPNQSALLELINQSLNPFVDEVTLNELDLITVNSNGTLSSSTGVLADPSAGILPARPEPDPVPSVPASLPPSQSDAPEPSRQPDSSQPPQPSAPGSGEGDEPAASGQPDDGGGSGAEPSRQPEAGEDSEPDVTVIPTQPPSTQAPSTPGIDPEAGRQEQGET